MSGCCSNTKKGTKNSDSESVQAPLCHHEAPSQPVASCCDSDKRRVDYLLWGSLSFVSIFYVLALIDAPLYWALNVMSDAVYQLMNTMAWGLALGVVMVSVLHYVPREFVISILGSNKGFKGLIRATGAGLLLDLCSHGILMVGAKLYERGASLGQVIAFLIASPWNSLSLTVVLVTLIGLGWTLTFIFLSAIIAMTSGYIFEWCVANNILPDNPNKTVLPDDFHFYHEAKKGLASIQFSQAGVVSVIKTGLQESRMVIKWLLLGVLLAGLIRTFVPEDYFGTYFGPTFIGLGVTLTVATLLEVCSEGSTPIAADIFNRAAAPGNSFAFLMTGVSTDYTEIMVLKERMQSWKVALFLPLITLPQIIVIALLINTI